MSISSLLSQLVDIFKNWSHDTPEPYVLPAATANTLGGVKVGDGLSVTEDGTLSAPSSERGKFVLTWVPNDSSPVGGSITIDSAPCTVDEFQEVLESGQFPWDIIVKHPSPYVEDEETVTLAYHQSIIQGDGALGICALVNLDPLSFSKIKIINLAGLPGVGFGAFAINGNPPYTLPAATTTALGGVKVGTGLSVTEDGTLSASGGIETVVITATPTNDGFNITNVSKLPEEIVALFTTGTPFQVIFNGAGDWSSPWSIVHPYGIPFYNPNDPNNPDISFQFSATTLNGTTPDLRIIYAHVTCSYDSATSSWGDWEVEMKVKMM